MKILGSVDRCDDTLIEGWITVAENPDIKLTLDIKLDGNVIGTCTADQFRQDLKQADLGGGFCAFSFKMPAFVPKSQIRRVVVALRDSPLCLSVPTVLPSLDDATVGDTVSRFGGLWIDRNDWIDRLAQKHRAGQISDELSVAIFRFVRDGYVVFEGAVDSSQIDAVNDQIDSFWVAPPKGLKIETFEPDGLMNVIAPDLRWREGRTKMLDLFAHSRLVRQVVASPKVVEFLAAIFEDEPKAFQGLTFWNGSQQAIHKDTAYVKVDSNPMHLAATWLALEDIELGTGELEYYVGSHRAPDYLFGGVHKWMESHVDEHDDFLASLHSDAKKFSHKKSCFLARKGDVLVWHADLAHGGSAITTPGNSRRSLVTHFTAASDEPFYRRSAQYSDGKEGGCHFVSQYGDVT